ncbi:MAG: virulence factor [Chloroflexi bacterium]|nr:virulence factor [Chloroflexota bacterium]
MASVRVMYWKEIPAQVQAEDENGKASAPLAGRFQEGIDAIAMFDGSAGTDDYLMAWELRDYSEVDGAAADAANMVAERFNSGFPLDFVARIRDLQNSGQRDTSPGSIDDWLPPE